MVSPTVNEYMDYATVHGLGRLKNAPFSWLKVVWILCLCGSLAMIILQFYLLFTKYQSKPVSTVMEMKNPEKTDFPVVTICNTNPLNYHLIDANSSLNAVLEAEADKYNIGDVIDGNGTENASYIYSSEPYDSDILTATGEVFRMAMNAYSTEELIDMSQLMSDFILMCTYNGDNCTKKSIKQVRTYEYGICYSIFPEYQEHHDNQTRLVAASGKRYGLELLLNIDEFNGVPFVTQSSGVYVMAHSGNYDVDSLFLADGVIVSTGVDADVKISKVEEVKVSGGGSEPRCNKGSTTLTKCLHECQRQHSVRICGCYQSYLDFVESNGTQYYDYVLCETESEYKCLQRVLAAYVNEVPEQCSSCRVPCEDTYFKASVSLAAWPSRNFVPVLKRMLSTIWGNSYVSGMDEGEIWQNMLMVRIYLSSMSYESIKEEYAYSGVNFISDIGGTLGLWAGFSVLSVIEVFELFFLLGFKRRQRMNEGNSVRQVVETEGVDSK